MERLALIEVLDHHGRVLQAVPVVRWPVTLGRALDCDVVLDDPHVAAHHATLDAPADGSPGVVLAVGQSLNGVQLERRRLDPGSSTFLRQGFEFRAGRSALRVRLPGEALTAERPLRHSADRIRLPLTVGGVALVLAWIAAVLWLDNLPGSGWDKYVPALLGAVFVMVIWSVLWGLGSKLFQQHFRVGPHLRVLVGFVLALLALDALLALGSYALSVPLLSHIREWVLIVMIAALLGTHAWLLLPGRQRAIAWTVGGICVLVLSVDGALNWRHRQRLFDELYVATLPPPALRLVRPEPVSVLLEDLRPLQARLERRARKDEDLDVTLVER